MDKSEVLSIIAALGANADDVARTVAHHCGIDWCKQCLCGTCPISKCIGSMIMAGDSESIVDVSVDDKELICELVDRENYVTLSKFTFVLADCQELNGLAELVRVAVKKPLFWREYKT